MDYDLTGCDFVRAGLSLKPKKITGFGGWTKEEKDVSTLANASFLTTMLGKLKKSADISVTFIYDAAEHAAFPEGNLENSIIIPGAGTLVFWGDVKELGGIDTEADGDTVTFDVSFTVSNLDASGVETAPTFTAV